MPKATAKRVLLSFLLSLARLASARADELLLNDEWPSGGEAFQSGFAAGEIAAVRLEATATPCPCRVNSVTILFGGAPGPVPATLLFWDDVGNIDPGLLLAVVDVVLPGSAGLQTIGLADEAVVVDDPSFRVGIRFGNAGLPSIARDNDGTILASHNFIQDAGGWIQSSTAGIIGDWVIRASVSPDVSELVRNDGWAPAFPAAFQSGFDIGEIPASRFTPVLTCPCLLEGIDLMFGGAAGTETVTVRVWTDPGGSAAPGTPLGFGDFELQGNDTFPNHVHLRSLGIVVPQSFRVGIEHQHAGLPSIARDDDGTIDGSANFIFLNGSGWVYSSSQGIVGDWILRARVLPVEIFSDGFESSDTSAWSATVP